MGKRLPWPCEVGGMGSCAGFVFDVCLYQESHSGVVSRPIQWVGNGDPYPPIIGVLNVL